MSGNQNEEIALRLKYVGKPLKRWRTGVGLSQSCVASTLHYGSPQFISNWERGIAMPPMDILPRLIALYKIRPETLINTILRYQEQLMIFNHSELTKLLSNPDKSQSPRTLQ